MAWPMAGISVLGMTVSETQPQLSTLSLLAHAAPLCSGHKQS